MDQSPQERFRRLFHQLDADDVWSDSLQESSLQYVRKLAENRETWAAFLAGNREQHDLKVLLSSQTPDTSLATVPAEKHGVNCEQVSKKQTIKDDGDEMKDEVISMDIDEHLQAENAEAFPDIKVKSHPPHRDQSPRLSASDSPRCSRVNLSRIGIRNTAKSDIAALSALIRRRLAIESVNDQLFHSVHGALPEDDERYEIDVGMMPGDDGGLTSYEELLRDDAAQVKRQTSVYTLLGSNEEVDFEAVDGTNGATSPKERRNGTPKRPRSSSLGLIEHMEAFIRGLRELCEPHRDAAQEESEKRKDVPKNIHRKAVSAASVVEELKDLEHKVRIGKIERVEDCISTVSAIIKNQNETFKDVLNNIEERANALRMEHRARKERQNAIVRVKELTTGVLGSNLEVLKDIPFPNAGDGDETLKESVQKSSTRNSNWKRVRRKIQIPFSEAELNCWPSGDTRASEVRFCSPRIPVFCGGEEEDERKSDDDDGQTTRHSSDNIVTVLGAGNPVMRNVLGWQRVYQLRAQVLSSQMYEGHQSSPQSFFPTGLKLAATESVHGTPIKNAPTLLAPSQIKQEDTIAAAAAQKPAVNPLHVAHSRIPEYEIKNDPYGDHAGNSSDNQTGKSREHALAHAVVALMCMHRGCTHASSSALEIMSDLLEDFIFRLGSSLASCRENIDSEPLRTRRTRPRLPTEDERFEMLRLICSSGFRGDFADLEQYVRSDIPRTEQALREAEIKLLAEISQIEEERGNKDNPQQNRNEADVSMVDTRTKGDDMSQKVGEGHQRAERQTRQMDVILNNNAFTFGHLSDHVSLDVLGLIKIPRTLVAPVASEEELENSKKIADDVDRDGPQN